MAIIKCPECGHQVSDKALTCPECGVEIKGKVTVCKNCNNSYFIDLKECPVCHYKNINETETIKNEEVANILDKNKVNTTPNKEKTNI